MTKNIVLTSSVIGVLISLISQNSVNLNICEKLDYGCRTKLDDLELATIFFIPVLFFSLITYFAPERVFQSWWRFARIGIPVAFVSALVINLELLLSPSEQWGALFSIPALIIIYGAFTIASAWQIWKGWRAK